MEQKYLGITPYGEDGSFEFVGRSEETWALYDRIVRNEYTVYYAASGEGKSSLIKAGLIPILSRRDFYPVYIVLEDKEFKDLSAIENVINSRIVVETKKPDITYEQSAWSKSRFSQQMSELLKSNVWWRLRNYCFKRGDTELKPLFIFDQFEEVFTKANYDWTDHFFTWLEEISTDYLPDSLRELVNSWGFDMPTQKNFRALFSFRTEYLGDLDYWCVQRHFIPSLQENRMCLKPLTPKGAKEIINLNEASLGKYADKIIQGCAEARTNNNNEEQPCVYALILSVVCQTLSEISDNERIPLLDSLNNQQDDTIDAILLRFYKRKLFEVGLDYNKDERIIADIENALVDEKGKRCRRDTDENSMRPLAKWIELLCDKSNGLLKIIGNKEVDGQTINTVEFPHDRLCKAIDSSRKERQGKTTWRLNRQNQWMQFGIISTLMGIIAFLWNALMPSIKPVISNVLSKTGYENVKGLFFSNYLKLKWQPSEYAGISLDEGYSTLVLMVLLIVFAPLITISIVRKSKKWQFLTTVISLFSCLFFLFLWFKNKYIYFDNSYVCIFTFIGLICSIVSLSVSIFKLRILYVEGEFYHSDKSQYSNWPLWGGYLIFALYVFYECLFRVTFGISEPCDSSWSLLVLPLLYTFWAWEFFNMEFHDSAKKNMKLIYLFSVLFLSFLCLISYIPFYNNFKQSYGFICSIVLILLWILASIYIFWHSKSITKYYILSKSKRLLAIILGSILIIITFIFNLGYNPIAINSKTVCDVSSWRNVLICKEDTITGKKFGVLYSTNGETIIPCCIPLSEHADTMLAKGNYPFTNSRIPIESKFMDSPFRLDSNNKNADNSMSWNPYNHVLTAYIPVAPTLEQYLHRKLGEELSGNSSFRDSIDYYAAKLFCEIRNANIVFVLEDKAYNLEMLESLEILDSLQHIALSNELSKFSLSSRDTITSSGGKIIRSRIEVLEDKHLIDFHCELTRSFLLCLIKDRTLQSDMPSMFTLANTYLMAYFTSVPSMNINIRTSGLIDFEANVKQQDKTISRNVVKKIKYDIYSDDILNRRFFAWYDLFNSLCLLDISLNSNTFSSNVYSNVEQIDADLLVFREIQEELLSILATLTIPTEEIIKNSMNTVDSASLIIDYWKKVLRVRDPKYYESILSRLELITPSIRTLAVDQSLKQLKDDVLNTLLPIMKKRETGIYNNDFENICKKLILVSAFRGNDIQEDMDSLSKYISEKNNIFDFVKELRSNIDSNFEQLLQHKKVIEEGVKNIVEVLEKY